jgi:hypothetical protein
MSYQFLNIDVDTITFIGISSSTQRMIGLCGTLVATACIMSLIYLSSAMANIHLGMDEALVAVEILLINYIAGGGPVVHTAMTRLFWITPLGVLYKRDKRVLESAKLELLAIIKDVKLQDYTNYGKINPLICSEESAQIIKEQASGNIEGWIENIHHLKALANMVYQIHLVEALLIKDARCNTPEP